MFDSPWIAVSLAVLATWRLAHLIAFEDGPWSAISRLRRAAGDGQLARLMDCPYCVSIWSAAGFALLITLQPADWLLTWWGVAGGAAVLEKLTASRDGAMPLLTEPLAADASAEPLVVDPAHDAAAHRPPSKPNENVRETSDVLLWEPSRRSPFGAHRLRVDRRPLGVPSDR